MLAYNIKLWCKSTPAKQVKKYPRTGVQGTQKTLTNG